MNKVHVIVNPFSARGRTAKRWDLIREAIRASFREFKYVFTEKPRQATEMARELLTLGFDLIIGVGGDGTLHEIANGFFRDESGLAVNGDAALAIVPSGTGSDFVRFHHLPRDFRHSAARIHDAPLRRFDVGRITFLDPDRPPDHRYFVNVADFGLGAEVIRYLESTSPQKRSALTYYRGLLATLMRFRAPRVTVEVDGRPTAQGRYLIGAVANGAIFGGGMIIAPEARADDGRFDLTLVSEMTRLQIIGNTTRLYRGTILSHPKVASLHGQSISVSAEEPVAIECDGELSGYLPAQFDLLPQKLNFRI